MPDEAVAALDRPWPVELTFKADAKSLQARFDDGVSFIIPYELLRIESPSAEVQGHSAAGKKWVAGKQDVGIERAEPVGRYALRLVFDDGHDSGIYTWDWLYRLGRDQDRLMEVYRGAIAV
ncbi:Gamma-butyrobetaine hydroxylase-like, N-terminal [Caulobacteraceae bacterium]